VVVTQALHEELDELSWLVRLRRVGAAALHREAAELALQSKDLFARGLAEVDHAKVEAGRVACLRSRSHGFVAVLPHGSRRLAFQLLLLRACHGLRFALLYAPGVVFSVFLLLPCNARSSSDHQGCKARRSPPKVCSMSSESTPKTPGTKPNDSPRRKSSKESTTSANNLERKSHEQRARRSIKMSKRVLILV
jgi:hypothetical protein